MRIAVTGGTGQLGRPVVEALAARGHEVISISRNAPTGALPQGVEHRMADFASGSGVQASIVGAGVVVDAMSDTRQAKKVLIEGAARLFKAERAVGIDHHIAISIVGCEKIPFSYYKIKAAEERRVEAAGIPWSLLRATQFHTLIDKFLSQSARLRLLPKSAIAVQPIAPEVAAERIADQVEQGPGGRLPEIAGPKIETVTELARQWRSHRTGPYLTFPLPLIGEARHALMAGALTNEAATTPGPSFAEWLAGERQTGS